MYEQAIKEAKPLPDFTGSDDYFVKLTLDGQTYNPHMLALVKKTSDYLLESLTTDDYILLSLFFHRKRFLKVHQSRFEHLAELGFVSLTENKIELINGGITLLTDESGIHIVENGAYISGGINGGINVGIDNGIVGIDKGIEKNADKILKSIRAESNITQSKLSTDTGLSVRTVARELKRLRDNGVIRRIGSNRAGYWEITKDVTSETHP